MLFGETLCCRCATFAGNEETGGALILEKKINRKYAQDGQGELVVMKKIKKYPSPVTVDLSFRIGIARLCVLFWMLTCSLTVSSEVKAAEAQVVVQRPSSAAIVHKPVGPYDAPAHAAPKKRP